MNESKTDVGNVGVNKGVNRGVTMPLAPQAPQASLALTSIGEDCF